MDAKLINPFVNATMQVLTTMASTRAKVGKPFLKKDNIACGDVTGIVGITGDVVGTVSITFDSPSIFHIVSAMLGEEINDLDDGITDAVGELANMISGQARRELEEKGRLLHGSIPTVITGRNHMLIHVARGPKIGIPFDLEIGKFTMEVCLAADQPGAQ